MRATGGALAGRRGLGDQHAPSWLFRVLGREQQSPNRHDNAASRQARSLPITAAFVVEGNWGECVGSVPSAAFAGGGRLTAGGRGPPGSSFVVLSGRGGQRSAVAQLRRPGPPNPSRGPLSAANEVGIGPGPGCRPNRRRDDSSRSHAATRARPSLRVRRTHAPPARCPRSRRTR